MSDSKCFNENRADAGLVAATPELYAVVRLILEEVDGDYHLSADSYLPEPLIQAMRWALEKAEGRSLGQEKRDSE